MRRSLQSIVLFHRFRELLEAAADAGVDVAPVKGAHLLTSVYPADEDRGPLSDVDFLVRDAQWGRALELAARLGWRRRPSAADEAGAHEVGFHAGRAGEPHVLLEMHRSLFDPLRLAIDHAAIWARSTPGSFDGAPCRRLAPEDHVVHVALHELLHGLESLERTLRDAELLLAAMPIGRDAVADRAREWRATRAVWLVTALLAARRPELGLEPLRDALAPNPITRRAARRAVDLARALALPARRHRLAAALLWPLLIDDPTRLLRLVGNHPSAVAARRRLRGALTP
jgi:hypothetical protein